MAVKIAKEKKSKEVKPTQDKAAILKPISKKRWQMRRMIWMRKKQ